MLLCDVCIMPLAANSWAKSNLGNQTGAMHAKSPSQVPNLREKLTMGEAFPKETPRLCWNGFKEERKKRETNCHNIDFYCYANQKVCISR